MDPSADLSPSAHNGRGIQPAGAGVICAAHLPSLQPYGQFMDWLSTIFWPLSRVRQKCSTKTVWGVQAVSVGRQSCGRQMSFMVTTLPSGTMPVVEPCWEEVLPPSESEQATGVGLAVGEGC